MSDAPQKLRFLDTALYGLALGTGIRWIAVAAAVGPSSLSLWVLALVVFYLPLACATAVLSGRFEGEGGIYMWTRDSFGPLWGFLCGWSYWTAQFPYFAGILYFLSGLVLAALGGDPKDRLAYIAISVAILAIVTGAQLLGMRFGKWLPNIGTTAGWIVFAVIVAMAVAIGMRGESATHFLSESYLPHVGFDTAILWGTLVFAYSGIEALGFLRNEVEGGMKTLLRVLVIVGAGSTIIYLLGTVSFLVVLPRTALSRLGGFPDALAQGLGHVGVAHLAPYVIGLFALGMLGQFTGWFGVAARLPFAAGIDAFLPPLFARRSPKTGAPVAAIWLQSLLTLAMVLLSQAGASVGGAYDYLVAMGVLTAVVPYLFMFAAYLKIAPLAPGAQQWSPPGGARMNVILGIVGLVSTLIAIACTLVPNADEPHPLISVLKIAFSFAAICAIGILFYGLASLRPRKAAAE